MSAENQEWDGKTERRKEPYGRRVSDRKWPRILRDFWLVLITIFVVLALNTASNQAKDVCNGSNALRKQLNERTPLVTVVLNNKNVRLPIASADLLKLSAALTHTRLEEQKAFGVFLLLTEQSIKEQQTQGQRVNPRLQALYVSTLKGLVGDYALAAKLDSQVRDSIGSTHYEIFPYLDCSKL